MKKSIILLSMVSLFLCGCIFHRTYDLLKVPPSDRVSILRASGINITKLDGEAVPEVLVLSTTPGVHELEINYYKREFKYSRISSYKYLISFNTEANHIYKIEALLEHSGWTPYITDQKTNKILDNVRVKKYLPKN